MVGLDGCVRHGRRTAAATALADQLSQFLDRRFADLNLDVGHAPSGVYMYANDMGVLAKAPSNEIGARPAAPPTDRHAQRSQVIASLW